MPSKNEEKEKDGEGRKDSGPWQEFFRTIRRLADQARAAEAEQAAGEPESASHDPPVQPPKRRRRGDDKAV